MSNSHDQDKSDKNDEPKMKNHNNKIGEDPLVGAPPSQDGQPAQENPQAPGHPTEDNPHASSHPTQMHSQDHNYSTEMQSQAPGQNQPGYPQTYEHPSPKGHLPPPMYPPQSYPFPCAYPHQGDPQPQGYPPVIQRFNVPPVQNSAWSKWEPCLLGICIGVCICF